jgi:hypothetical protein
MKTMIPLSLAAVVLAAAFCQAQPAPKPAAPAMTLTKMDDAKQKDWLARWDKGMTGDERNRYCDKAVGEDIAWLMTPFMEGFYYGYMATKDTKWIDKEIDWADSLIKRAVKEPDGYLGWPSPKAAGTAVDSLDDYNADSFLSDTMVFRPIVLTAGAILKDPALKAKYGEKAEGYLKLAEQMYEKWVKRGGWRETKDGGMISVTLPYGMNKENTKWVDFDTRNDPGNGFSHPDNKANKVASWLLAMWDVTGKAEYKDRAEKWFKLLKSRMQLQSDGTYKIWNYWQAAGPWDYKKDGTTKHGEWVHPTTGYYEADLTGIVDAYEHGVVFTKADIDNLIVTGKTAWAAVSPGGPVVGMTISILPTSGTAKTIFASFPNAKTAEPISAGAGALSGKVVSVEWNDKAKKGKIVVGPKDAAAAPVTFDTDGGTKTQVLRIWGALAPYDVEYQRQFEAALKPDSWGGLAGAPYYLMLQAKLAGK